MTFSSHRSDDPETGFGVRFSNADLKSGHVPYDRPDTCDRHRGEQVVFSWFQAIVLNPIPAVPKPIDPIAFLVPGVVLFGWRLLPADCPRLGRKKSIPQWSFTVSDHRKSF